jgi:maleylacetoacetate isomerase
VRWSLAHHGLLDSETLKWVAVNLLNGESESESYRKIHPLGLVPALALHEGPVLLESLSILEWLEERGSAAPSLLPEDPLARAHCRALSLIIASDTQPLQNLGPQFLHAPDDPEARARWARHWIREGLAGYEVLARQTAGVFSVGNRLSIADLCLVPQLYNARRYQIAVEEEFPLLTRIEAEALKTPSAKASHPDRFAPEGQT